MTTTASKPAGTSAAPDLVNLTVDGVPVSVPKGTLVIRAAETIGVEIPRFCDHPLLEPVGACRQCLVDVAMPDREGNVRPMPKPQASCTMAVSEGMVVNTQATSQVADKAQQGVMELLLINHPLDCPVCDKGGECPLQNQAMSAGRPVSRFEDVKRTYPKPVNISSQVLLDRERCVLCARCTRFSDQIAGDPFIALVERGALQQIGIYEEKPFESYFSGNTVQICPVGALTGAAYRFRSRPFDLVSTPSICEHCASGCAIRTDHRRGVVLRRLAAEDQAVNEEWNCDKGRWAFTYASLPDRVRLPMVRDADGELQVVGWPEALSAAAAGLSRAAAAGVLVGGRVSAEDAYAYGKFARVVLGTNDVDFRSRPHSAEEVAFLAEHVAATGPEGGSVTYAELEQAKAVLLVGFEPEDESPIVFLRLRKAHRQHRTQVYAVASHATRGLTKLGGTLLPTVPGHEASALADLGSAEPASELVAAARAALGEGGVILVGERLATSPGALRAAADLAAATGARLAWVPRRAGERGALEAGALGALLPGGRPVSDAAARAEVARVWDVEQVPATPARDTAGIVAAAAAGDIEALLIGGVDPSDLGDPAVAAALEKAFVVSLELRESPVTAVADVVLPVASQSEKTGTYVNWEGRVRAFEEALESNAVSDHRALDMLAGEMGVFLETRTQREIHAQFEALGPWGGARATSAPQGQRAASAPTGTGDFVLSTWATLLDAGRMQDGEPFLAGTAPLPVARLSTSSAAGLLLEEGDSVTVTGPTGSVTLPAVVTEGMVDGVVWIPTNSVGCSVRSDLGTDAGGRVHVTKGAAA